MKRALALLAAVPLLAAASYGQIAVHTADGGYYVITGDLSGFVYKQVNGDFVLCVILNNAIGLPPSDTIFRDGFDAEPCFSLD